MPYLLWNKVPGQESVFWEIMNLTNVIPAILESGLVLKGNPINHNTCGNVGHNTGDNGEKDIRTMGYILVQ